MTSAQERVSNVGGDRLCVRCGFNLLGQPVVREPVYGMLMVRCPECAAPAALQEYPVLGKWAGRWAALLAAIWLLVLLGLLAATTGMVGGLSAAATEAGSVKLATKIGDMHAAWIKGLDDEAKKGVSQWLLTNQMSGAYSWVDTGWWAKQDGPAIVAAEGGWARSVNRGVIAAWCGVMLAGFAAGMVWSVALLGARRWKVGLIVMLAPAIACAIALMIHMSGPVAMWMPAGAVMARSLAQDLLGPGLFAATAVVAAAGMWVGVWAGRPVVRWLVRALLPPRAASALGVLWLAEGKEPPRVTPRPRGSR